MDNTLSNRTQRHEALTGARNYKPDNKNTEKSLNTATVRRR